MTTKNREVRDENRTSEDEILGYRSESGLWGQSKTGSVETNKP